MVLPVTGAISTPDTAMNMHSLQIYYQSLFELIKKQNNKKMN